MCFLSYSARVILLTLLVLCAVFSLCYVYVLDFGMCSYSERLMCSVWSLWLAASRLVARFARIARFARLPFEEKDEELVLSTVDPTPLAIIACGNNSRSSNSSSSNCWT